MSRIASRLFLCLLLAVLLAGPPAWAADWYVSTTGSAGNNGSIGSPWDLQTALDQPAGVQPGDTIWLRGGTYNGFYTSELNGTSGSPITVRSYTGEWAVIRGPQINNQQECLQVTGSYTWFRDFEITSAGTDRVAATDLSWPDDINYAGGLEAGNYAGQGVGCKAIGLVIHDTDQGMNLWSYAEGFETVGCIIYHNGWEGVVRGHGHGLYVQNQNNVKLFRDNIVFSGFSYGAHCYGSDTAYEDNLTFEYNTFFDAGVLSAISGGDNVLLGGGRPVTNAIFNYNKAYCSGGISYGGIGLGHNSPVNPNNDIEVQYNYFGSNNNYAGGMSVKPNRWYTISLRYNTFVGPRALVHPLTLTNLADVPAYDWDYNTYYCSEYPDAWATWKPFHRYKAGAFDTWQSWTEWRNTTNYDAHSTYTNAYPTSAAIFVRATPYDTGRGTIVVFNWPQTDTVSVDISAVVGVGQPYTIRDAQNYFGSPVASGTYGGGNISLPMTGMTAAQPTGNGSRGYTHTPKEFGAFVIKATGGGGGNQAPAVGAGTDRSITLPTNSVALDGTVSDDGLPNPPAACTATWSKISGPGTVTFSAPNAADTNATFSTSGTYVLRLTASDSALNAYDECSVTVNPQATNQAPAVNAGIDRSITLPTNSLALDGTVSDDGLPNPPAACTQTWSKQSGPGTVTFSAPSAADTNATFSTSGTYVLRLTASDTALNSYDECTVTVNAATGLPAMLMQLLMDEGTGTAAADASGNNHPGTLMNGATWVAGYDGNAVHMNDASRQYVSINDFNYGPEFTLSFWFKLDNNTGGNDQYFFTHGGSTGGGNTLNILINESGAASNPNKIYTYLRDSTDGSFTTMPFTCPIDAYWHLYTLTVKTGEGCKVYLDGGAPKATDAARGGDAFLPNTGIYLGTDRAIQTVHSLRGTLDDVRIWAGALTEAQVEDLYGGAPPENQAPVVDAGIDRSITLPTNSLALDGTVTDDGLPGGGLTQTWTKQSGPGTVTFSAPTAADTNATFSVAGTYVLRLTASDTALNSYDECIVTVNPQTNQAPSVSAGTDRSITLPTNSLSLDGTVSDDGLPNPPAACTQTWSTQSGPGTVTFSAPSAADTNATFSTSGTYVLRLTASDTALNSYDECAVTVNAAGGGAGPIMQLLMDEGTGTVTADASGNNHTGTLVNGATWVAGYDGNAVHMNDASRQYVSINDFNYGPEFTLSFWFKLDNNTGGNDQYFYTHGGSAGGGNTLNILINESGAASNPNKIYTYLRDSTDGSFTTMPFTCPIDAYWHLYTLTVKTGQGCKVYLDGEPMANDPAKGGDAFLPSTGIYLGTSRSIEAVHSLRGSLDDVRLYNRALTDAEVEALMEP